MNGGVSGLIKANAEKVTSLEDLVALCTGKSYTSSRIRRAILSAVLEITENDIKAKPLFTTLLGTSDKGREYLNSIRKSAKIKIITKPADGLTLEEAVAEQYKKSLESDRLMAQLRHTDMTSVLKKSPVLI